MGDQLKWPIKKRQEILTRNLSNCLLLKAMKTCAPQFTQLAYHKNKKCLNFGSSYEEEEEKKKMKAMDPERADPHM